MRLGVRLGLDPGDARIGVASCDPAGIIATPVETVQQGQEAFDRLVALVAEFEPMEIVVGLPTSLNGREGPAAAKVRTFAHHLSSLVAPVGVRLVDERLTTVSAHQALRASGRKGKRTRAVVDQAAAVVILQHALDSERVSGKPGGELLIASDQTGTNS
ncbi:MAG: Holliday junction resolvase RuvX [Marmoricola sp.]